MADLNILEITDDDEVGRIISEEIYEEFCEKYILVGEENTCFPEYYLKYADDIKNFEMRDDDVIVTSYPKSGTTWTQEMVWLIANNLDFKGAEVDLVERFRYLEICIMFDCEKMDKALNINSPDLLKNSIEFTKQQKSPRFMKTHLPFYLLPDDIHNGSKTPKIIYVMRNAKDTCVSYYHHGKLLQRWRTTLENFAKVFIAGKAIYGSYWKHIMAYWKRREYPNILIIKYEDMKEDLPSVIRKVASFLNKELTEEQIQILSKHLSFESMKKNQAVNGQSLVNLRNQNKLIGEDEAFIRTGIVGKYKEELSAETIEIFDAWIKKNIDGTDFGMQYNYDW